jgi:hypothetical protein
LTLYRVLTHMGYPVELHFGVCKAGDDLQGHSWVTIEGKPVAERTGTYLYKTVYSYPSVPYPAISPDKSRLLQAFLSARGGNHGREESPAGTRTCSDIG